MADLNITLGTTLQIVPSGNLPLKNIKGSGKLVVCNLQPTKHDSKAHLVISSYVDEILSKVCNFLGVEISEYSESSDPTTLSSLVEWTLPFNHINIIQRHFRAHLTKQSKKKKQTQSDCNRPGFIEEND